MPTKIAGTYNTEYIEALNRHYAGGGKAIFFCKQEQTGRCYIQQWIICFRDPHQPRDPSIPGW